jgi:hypothetical protein
MAEYTEKQLDIFNRLGNQLLLTKKLLESHPLVSSKLNILQTVLHNFSLQSEWSSAGKLARLLMTVKMTLEGHEIGKSSTGFAGPSWMKLQKGAFGLMKATLNVTERKQADLLFTFNEIMSLGAAYLATQILGTQSDLFPRGDPVATKRAGFLLRELGLTFLIHSRLIQAAYGEVTKGLGINEKSQKLVMDIGLFFLLTILVLIDAEDNPKNEDLLEAFIPYLKKSMDSVETAFLMAHERGMMTQELGLVASSQIQLIKRAIESESPEAIREAIENSFQVFEIPYGEIKKDIAHINRFMSQVNESFNNIFFQSKLTVTTMTQAA